MTLNHFVSKLAFYITRKGSKMSRMGDIAIEIQDRLERGEDPQYIAKTMNIPIHWVYAEIESNEVSYEEFNPYNTLNS